MAANYKNFLNGIALVPKGSTNNSALGDLEVLNTTNKLSFHNGSTSSPIVTETHTATLTNKTLTSPVISTIVNTGTLTLPTATDTLVGRATTDTFTNKSIDGSTNTLTNVPDSALSANVVLKVATQTLTNKTLTSPVINTPTADTITGIAAAALTIQPASGQNLVLSSNGAGLISHDNITFKTNAISTSSGALTIGAVSGNNVFINGSGTGTIQLQRSGSTIATIDTAGLTLGSAKTLVLANNTQTVTFQGHASASASYTITLPAAAPTASTALVYDGTNYVWSTAGGWTNTTSSALAGGGTIAISTTAGQQKFLVAGNGGAVTLSSTPFGASAPVNGAVIRLVGSSNTNTVTLTNSSASKGCVLNGAATLFQYYVIEFQYDSTLDVYVETHRNW